MTPFQLKARKDALADRALAQIETIKAETPDHVERVNRIRAVIQWMNAEAKLLDQQFGA